jgi:hypothetical protein
VWCVQCVTIVDDLQGPNWEADSHSYGQEVSRLLWWRKLHEELHGLYSSPKEGASSKQGGWGGRGMWRAWGRWGVHTTFWLGGLKGGDHWEDLGVDGRITLRWVSGKQGFGMWIGFVWFRTGTGGGLLWTGWWAFGFHKMRGISWPAERTLCFSRRTLLRGVNLRNWKDL